MSDPRLILHQYDTSPFSEKVRRLLAHKRLAWSSVEQPTMLPKPDLLPLTGGYRRIPVLQIGADVYCDTQLVVRVLERLHPEPTIYPEGSVGTCHAWNLWADRMLFLPLVSVIFAEIGQFVPKEFIEDRTRMMPGRDFAEVPKLAPGAREQVRSLVAGLEAQLADGRAWLLGGAFSLADAACYHPLWFLRVAPRAAAMLDEFPHVVAWSERVAALGGDSRTVLAPADALEVARRSTPATSVAADAREPNGLAPGRAVAVTPDDYAFDPVRGELVASSVDEIVLRRSDPDLGELMVHFPRVGFTVAAA